MKQIIFAVLVMSLLASITNAQDYGSAIPKCTLLDFLVVSEDLDEFFGDLTSFGEKIRTGLSTDTFLDYALDAEELQVRWWGEITPEFPRCAALTELSLTVGRALDEVLIGLTLGHVALQVIEENSLEGTQLTLTARRHADRFTELMDQGVEIISTFSE